MNDSAPKARPQRGVALITAVLVVSLSVIAATAVLDAGHYAILRTATLQNSEMAWWYAAGAEDWVGTALQLDREQSDYDGLDELWAKPQVFPIDHGVLAGELSDALGRFNLNNLGLSKPPDGNKGTPAPDNYIRQRNLFLRLVENIPGGPDAISDPEGLADAIRDWVDSNDEPTFNGKEDLDYQILDPAHLAANRPMSSVTELRAVLCALYDCKRTPEVPRRIYDLLRPYVTVLPVDGITPINLNTAPPALLLALSANPGPKLRAFLDERLERPLESVGQIDDQLDLKTGTDETENLTIATNLFELRVNAVIGSAEDSAVENARVALYSLIFRPDKGAPVVLYHSTDTE